MFFCALITPTEVCEKQICKIWVGTRSLTHFQTFWWFAWIDPTMFHENSLKNTENMSESVAICNVYLLFVAIKCCLIAAKIAGSIGILPCCILNDFFHTGAWTFARFVRPLLATILCIIWNLVPAYTCITYFPVGKKRASSHQFWSRPLTRNSSPFCIMYMKLEKKIVLSYFRLLSKSSRCFSFRWKHFEIIMENGGRGSVLACLKSCWDSKILMEFLKTSDWVER